MVTIYIVLVVILFGALIAIHEFGHFIAAKISGVRVNEFAIGMGPAIFKKKIGETLYALRLLPLGGYCAMEGEDEESEDKEHSFSAKPLFSRILIVASGPIMNLIIGVLVLVFVFLPVTGWTTPTLAQVDAHINGLQAGDTILEIDGYDVVLFADFHIGLDRGENKPFYDIEVLRNGEKVLLEDVKLELREFNDNGEKTMRYGLTFTVEQTSFINKTKYVFKNAYNLVRLVIVGLGDLISGSAGLDDMAGPIGISSVMVDTAKESMMSLWYLLALVSINLGVMNLLPIPALDGGRLFFMIIELIRRKPIPPKYEGWVHAAGFAILILLMIFVAFNDIFKLFTGG